MNSLQTDITKEELLQRLRSRGITSESVLQAISIVRREDFVPAAFRRKAYNDVALPIGMNQTISQPYTVAFMTQTLNVQPGCRVLEVGTGSGYQAAILSAMGARVVSLERHRALYDHAVKVLHGGGFDVECILGDGSSGFDVKSPYDRIIVTAGAPSVPMELAQQLKVGGIMVVPVGDSVNQKMCVVTRSSETTFTTQYSTSDFSFVPLLGEFGWEQKSQKSQ